MLSLGDPLCYGITENVSLMFVGCFENTSAFGEQGAWFTYHRTVVWIIGCRIFVTLRFVVILFSGCGNWVVVKVSAGTIVDMVFIALHWLVLCFGSLGAFRLRCSLVYMLKAQQLGPYSCKTVWNSCISTDGHKLLTCVCIWEVVVNLLCLIVDSLDYLSYFVWGFFIAASLITMTSHRWCCYRVSEQNWPLFAYRCMVLLLCWLILWTRTLLNLFNSCITWILEVWISYWCLVVVL